jgi:tetratricopeptide (TPR) repeat protein
MRELQDIDQRLVELERQLEQRLDPETSADTVQEILRCLPVGSKHRPKALRLSGVVKNRRKLHHEALAELAEAKKLALTQRDYCELGKIEREVSVIYAWRGDDRSAAIELLDSLALNFLEENRTEAAKTILELARLKMEVRQFAQAEVLLRAISKVAAQHLPSREGHRMRLALCQTLNRLGNYREAAQWAAKLNRELPATEFRLRFLVSLEEVRTLAGLEKITEAEHSLSRSKDLIGDNEKFEQTEYSEVLAELKLRRNDLTAIEDLRAVADDFMQQDLLVRSANVQLALADKLFVLGEKESARDVLALALRRSLTANLLELADRIRSAMIQSAGGALLAELAQTVQLLGGQTAINRRFSVLKRIGRGGFAEVYKATDLNTGETVAIKKLDLTHYAQNRREFVTDSIRTEYSASLIFVHPACARVLDLLIEPKGVIYVVQEFIEGPTLRQVFKSGLSARQMVLILADVAEALAALHAKGIVHRDLKPENIILRDGHVPVLIDLGIAALAGRIDVLQGIGTAGYVAPEQARGDKVDYRADVYSLGKMIAEIWNGKTSFSLFRLRQAKKSPPRTIARLVRGMLRNNPKRRLADLKLIAADLRASV